MLFSSKQSLVILKWFGYNYFFNFCGTWYANSHFTSCLQPGFSFTMIWILPITSSLTDLIKDQAEFELGQVNSSRYLIFCAVGKEDTVRSSFCNVSTLNIKGQKSSLFSDLHLEYLWFNHLYLNKTQAIEIFWFQISSFV